MKNKKLLGGVAALVLVCAVFFGVWTATRPEVQQGAKALTVEVVHKNGEAKTFDFRTDAEYLSDALLEQKIVEDNQTAYGLYILAVDGETADESNQEWWCLTKGGEVHMSGASETVIADGDAYELTLTVGYGF